MAFSAKSFHSRNHIEGQLIGAAELIEMQDLANTTLCNIEADRHGLNDDATFTPHVIAGLKPSKVTGEQKIRISRGHGWVVDSPSGAFFNFDRIPIFLEEELEVDIPAGDATHPKWCQIMLRNPLSGKNVKYGNANVSVQDVNRVITTVTVPLYNRRYTAEAILQEGTAAASPDCPMVTNVSYLPIATVYIPAGFSGEVDPANLYDVRWFAPGFGHIGYTKFVGDTAFVKTCSWLSAREITAPVEDLSGIPNGVVGIPAKSVFPLIPGVSPTIKVFGTDVDGGVPDIITAAEFTRGTDTVSHPLQQFNYAVTAWKSDGSGIYVTTGCPRWISIDFNPVH